MHKIECHVPCRNPIYLDKHECPICESKLPVEFCGNIFNDFQYFNRFYRL